MLVVLALVIATVAFMWLVPRRRAENKPFDWTKRSRFRWLRRWRARGAFPNGR